MGGTYFSVLLEVIMFNDVINYLKAKCQETNYIPLSVKCSKEKEKAWTILAYKWIQEQITVAMEKDIGI